VSAVTDSKTVVEDLAAPVQKSGRVCGTQTETPDGKTYVCVLGPRHQGNHEDTQGVEWSSLCAVRWHGQPDARVKCQLKAGHRGHHRCNRVEWL
jgi:hypothetical protein